MQTNTIKRKLQDGGWVLGTCLTDFLAPEAVTVAKAAGMEHFFIDCEHARASFTDVQTLVRTAKGLGIVPLVRVADIDYALVARTLDIGAFGIIAPRIDSLDQVKRLVDVMKFPPKGRRGYGLRGIVNDMHFTGAQNEMDSADAETMVILQMETQEFVDQVDEMTAVEGVDATMVGPFDLSVSLGIPGEFDHPKFWAAIDRMVEACEKNGVAPGVHAATPDQAAKYRERGLRFLTCGTDVSVLLRGLKQIRETLPGEEPSEKVQSGYM